VKRALGIPILAFLVFPLSLQSQEGPPPEVGALDSWVGEWSYKLGETGYGTVVYHWVGEFFLRYDESNTDQEGVTIQILGVMGYDVEEGVYTLDRYWGNGYSDRFKGTLEGNVWTFTRDEIDGVVGRVTITDGEDEKSFRWERSVDGGPWELTSDGSMQRVR
jgi:hypothetical protein